MYHMSKNNIIISDSKKNNNIERQYNYYLFIMVVGGGKGEMKQKTGVNPEAYISWNFHLKQICTRRWSRWRSNGSFHSNLDSYGRQRRSNIVKNTYYLVEKEGDAGLRGLRLNIKFIYRVPN